MMLLLVLDHLGHVFRLNVYIGVFQFLLLQRLDMLGSFVWVVSVKCNIGSLILSVMLVQWHVKVT